jgi:CBS-domain-containing membrane protein
MKIGSCMKQNVVSSVQNINVQTAVQILIHNRIGTLPIVDEATHLIGIVRMRDLIKLAMPDFVNLVENLDFVHDFGAVEHLLPGPEILNLPIKKIMGEPIAVEETAGLLRAVALMQEHKMNDLPVVDHEKHLVGIASYVDIGVALMSAWSSST